MQQTRTVRLGILGCANIVEKQIAMTLKEVPSCQLMAIASRDPQKAKIWGEKLGCRDEPSYEHLLRCKDIDAVYLPLPVGLHQEWVIKAAKAGKHILCEKSLAESYAAVKEMVQACRHNQVHLFENFMCHYHPQHEKVQELLENGELGRVFLFHGAFGFPPLDEKNIRYRQELGGGSLNDAGAYPLFMARKLFRSEPEKVTCRLQQQSMKKKYEVDIRGHALLEFPLEKTAFISFGFENFYQNNYLLWGETGLLQVKRAYSIPATMKPEVELQKPGQSQNIEVPPANHFALIFSAFADAIHHHREPNYGPLLAQARAMEALRWSAQKERTVRLSEIE